MLITLWSVKGGVGATTVAVAMAHALAQRHADSGGALLVDLAGDVPAALGLPDPGDPGLSGWTGAGTDVAGDALARLELTVAPGLAMLPRGSGPPGTAMRHEVLTRLLAADHRPVIVDAGLVRSGDPSTPVLAGATRSLLVARPCYLGLRRGQAAPIRPSGVVLVTEPGRTLDRADVERSVGAPVVAEIPVHPDIARAVDEGLLRRRIPRSLERPLRHAA